MAESWGQWLRRTLVGRYEEPKLLAAYESLWRTAPRAVTSTTGAAD